MKILPKILAVVLFLSGLMPFMAMIFSYADQPKVLDMIKLEATSTPELQTVIVMMGAALIFASLVQFVAAVWVWTGREAGISLAIWVGIMLVAAGAYMYGGLANQGVPNGGFYVVDLVKGMLVIVLAMVIRRKA